MGGSGFEGYDVDTLPDTMDVSCISGVPKGGGMALVSFGCKEEFERDIGGRRRVA